MNVLRENDTVEVAEVKAQRKVQVSWRMATPSWEQWRVRMSMSGEAGGGVQAGTSWADVGLVGMSSSEGRSGRAEPEHRGKVII